MNPTAFTTFHVTSTSAASPPRSDEGRPQVDLTRPAPTAGRRALVLGGGGGTGNAWVIGVLAGLAHAGLDVTDADLLIGTSSGSTAAAQTASAAPAELLDAILSAPAPQPPTAPTGSDRGRARNGPVVEHLERMRAIIDAADDVADWRRRMGAAALEAAAASDDSAPARWRATVAARLPSQRWPDRAMLITAVDADTGEPVVFDRHSGVDLADAVAASCAGGGFAYGIGARRYVDGGYRRSSQNADLAAGHGRVLVLSPLGGRSLTPVEWRTNLAAEVEELRAGGSLVETVVPDSAVEHALGTNAMDPSLRPVAARAGYDQGRALAQALTEFWR
jgi:NTE family protein